LAATLGCTLLAFAGGAKLSAQPGRSVEFSRPAVPARLAKLDARLQNVALVRERRGAPAAREAARDEAVTPTSRGVVVIVEAKADVATAANAVRAAGGVVDATAAGLIEAQIPTDRLAAAAHDPAVARVRAPGLHAAEDVTSTGVYAINAQVWQTAGFTGAGVKIGVIDLGFYGYARLLSTELPAAVTTQDFCGGRLATPPAIGDDHGTAVAEIVHDVAPDAQLYLICVDTEVDLANAVAYAKAQGITIVNHSVGWFNTSRGDGTGAPGTPDAIVADARANGILWVNAAGNEARSHWGGPWSDPDGDGAMRFFDVPLYPGQGYCAALRWDAWPQTTQDFDLLLVTPDDTVVAASEFSQADTPDEPTEGACYQNTRGAVQLVAPLIYEYNAPFFEGKLDLFVLDADLGGAVPAGSVIEPASSPAAVSVGAGAQCYTPTAPADYSSRGPTIDGRAAPDMLAPAGVSTRTYGAVEGCETGFLGTSAAAPHVAGAAALVRQRFPGLGPAGIHAWLTAEVEESDAFSVGVLWLAAPLTLGALAYGDGQVAIANGDGSHARRLGLGDTLSPALSPTGTRVAYSRFLDGNLELAVANVDGTNQLRLTTNAQPDVEPVWSPDGSKILFSGTRGGTPGLFTIKPDGTGEARVTSFPAHEPDYSPDGSKIAYVGETMVAGGVRNDIYVMNANGTGATNVTSGVPGPASSPSFSPDGTQLAFAANGDIYVMNANGGTKRNLTANVSWDRDPDWSADGWIAFAGGPLANGELSVMDEFGGHPGRLTQLFPRSVAGPDWIPGANSAPSASALPLIAGEARAGRFLAASTGRWYGRTPITNAFQWLRCNAAGDGCSSIPGATDSIYRAGAADAGGRLRVQVTANGAGSASATSQPTPVVLAAAPANVTRPSIAGQAAAGSTLTAVSGTWNGAPSAFLFQWLRCDDDPGCIAIPGASGGTYVPGSSDVGHSLRVAVRAVHPLGLSAGFTVASSPPVVVGPALALPPVPPPPPPPPPPPAAPQTDVSVTAVIPFGPSEVFAGQTALFEVSVSNQHATGTAGGVTLTYALPPGAAIIAVPPACAQGSTVVCNFGSLAPGRFIDFFRVQIQLNHVGTASNVFRVTANETDSRPSNNEARIDVTVKPGDMQPQPPNGRTTGVHKTGNARNNVLVGTRFADVLRGLAGNDILRGRAGNDLLDGGKGNDTLEGGAGNDRVIGGPGRDTIRCGPGKDRVTADSKDRVAKDCETVRR
jgi:subtilase family protein/hemolysin type calcium-binding protein/uncharacterized protein DUF11/WD40 repeat protein